MCPCPFRTAPSLGPVPGLNTSARPTHLPATKAETRKIVPAWGAGRPSTSPKVVDVKRGRSFPSIFSPGVETTRATTPEGANSAPSRQPRPSSRRTTMACGVRFTIMVKLPLGRFSVSGSLAPTLYGQKLDKIYQKLLYIFLYQPDAKQGI